MLKKRLPEDFLHAKLPKNREASPDLRPSLLREDSMFVKSDIQGFLASKTASQALRSLEDNSPIMSTFMAPKNVEGRKTPAHISNPSHKGIHLQFSS